LDTHGENNEVMTLAEVSEYLQLAERTVLRMAQRGEIPGAKVASQWRFMRSLVRDWLVAQMQPFPSVEAAEIVGRRRSLLPLSKVLRPELMALGVDPGPKESILRQLLQPVSESGFAQDTGRLLKSLLERERMMTTAVGHGVAVPHPRKPIPGMFPEPAIALGVCPKGTDFQAIDDELVYVFFLICATAEEVHLQLMASVSWLARQDVLADLKRVSSPTEAVRILNQCAGSDAETGRTRRKRPVNRPDKRMKDSRD